MYELLDDPPKLELGDGLINVLGSEADDILDEKFVNEKKQEEEALENFKEEYGFEEVKDAFEEGSVPNQLDFFYGGQNENFTHAVNFLSLSNDNREFIAFLISDAGQNIMTNNSLSIHIESGNIFYQNFNTNENFYNFRLAQQDETKAVVPKGISYQNSFEKYAQNFLPSVSIDDVEKFDLHANKNSKYLFYKYYDQIDASGGETQIIRYKVKDEVGMKKIEERDRQFLVEKIIHGIEFSNPYENSIEKKPEIIETVESNYRIIIRVYQWLYSDVADIFFEYIHSLNPDEILQLDEDLKSNELGAINLLEIQNSIELLSIMQLFYYLNGRLPLTNELLIVPDGEVPDGDEKINLKNLYETFEDTPSHGLVSLQFLSPLGIFFGIDINLPITAITELHRNLSYRTLSSAGDFSLDGVSDLTSEINLKIKELTLLNRDRKEKEDEISLEKINEDTTFLELPDQFEEDLIDDLLKGLEHKKTEHPYVKPQVEDAATIETEIKKQMMSSLVFNKRLMRLMVNDAAKEQKKKQNEVITYLTIFLMKAILLTI